MNGDSEAVAQPTQTAEEKEEEKLDREVELREQDRWLPIANVARLMKNTLPSTAKVSKDAKECMQECVSEFISFITSEASDKCLSEKRKTINGEDILFAMSSLGFENYAEVLKIYLAKYREQQALKQERGENKRPKKSQTSSSHSVELQPSQQTHAHAQQPSRQAHSHAQQPDMSVYDPHEQLEREMTNIPMQEEGDIDIESHISNDLMTEIKVDDEMLNLDERPEGGAHIASDVRLAQDHQQQHQHQGQQNPHQHHSVDHAIDDNDDAHQQHMAHERSPPHDYSNLMKTETDGVLYGYTGQY